MTVRQKRPYQQTAIRELRKLLEVHRSVCAVAPTGSGKTFVFARVLAQRWSERVLVIAHRVELQKQIADALIDAGIPASHVGILSGTHKRNTGARLLITSAAMLRSRDMPPGIELVVFDECHHVAAPGYQRILWSYPEAKILGVTATPLRLDGKPLGDSFAHLYVMGGMTDLIVDGYVANPITYGVPREKAKALVAGVRSMAGDYAQKDLERVASSKMLLGDVVQETMRLSGGKSTIVFATNREHGKRLTARFKEAGCAVEYLDGETPANERVELLARLKRGDTQVVVNVQVLTEGFDSPAVKCVAVARPTKSLTLFLQMCGRAARPYKNTRPLILDFAGNTHMHELSTAERAWSLDGRMLSHALGDAPVKCCSECGAIVAASAAQCSECGATLPLTEREIEEREADLERLRESADERQRKECVLRNLAASRGLGEEWVVQTMRDEP